MRKNKENALNDFYKMIKNSWTYAKMTEKEQEKLSATLFLNVPVENALKGTYEQRWAILQAIYAAFLNGIGYNDFSWREEVKEQLPF